MLCKRALDNIADSPVYGLIFLFKYDKRLYEGEDAEVEDVEGVFFAKQVSIKVSA